MSDYLWDKTGEADAEVERLEGLLGEFRHRPRALELPPEIVGHDDARPRASRLFRPAGFAVAAALLVAVLAGAFVALRRGATGGEQQGKQQEAASRDSRKTPPQDSPRQSPSPQVATTRNDETARRASESVKPDDRSEQGARDERTGNDERTAKYEQTPKRAVSSKQERWRDGVSETVFGQRGDLKSASSRPDEHDKVAPGATPRIAAEAASLEERRRLAKDDLMYVLRLTSLKLREVQRKTQKVDGWKSTFDEQKRDR